MVLSFVDGAIRGRASRRTAPLSRKRHGWQNLYLSASTTCTCGPTGAAPRRLIVDQGDGRRRIAAKAVARSCPSVSPSPLSSTMCSSLHREPSHHRLGIDVHPVVDAGGRPLIAVRAFDPAVRVASGEPLGVRFPGALAGRRRRSRGSTRSRRLPRRTPARHASRTASCQVRSTAMEASSSPTRHQCLVCRRRLVTPPSDNGFATRPRSHRPGSPHDPRTLRASRRRVPGGRAGSSRSSVP